MGTLGLSPSLSLYTYTHIYIYVYIRAMYGLHGATTHLTLDSDGEYWASCVNYLGDPQQRAHRTSYEL